MRYIETPEQAAKRRAAGCLAYADLADAPLPTKAEQARIDAELQAEFIEACKRAELKGDRARALIDSPECDPWANPVLIALRQAWVRDFEVKA